MPTQNDIRQAITNQIVAALTKGTVPWRRPWSIDKNAGLPANAVSRRCYSGINPLLLQIATEHHGFKSRWWATYRQWSDLGGQVMRRPENVPAGEWGTNIVFCKPCRKTSTEPSGETKDETFFVLRTYTVFCVDQVLGSDVDRFRVGHEAIRVAEIDERFEQAETAVAATGADIRFGGNQAFYQSAGDYIQMPPRMQWASTSDYFEALLHELCHWCEHESRLNWDRSKAEHTYSVGELIAELGACFLAGELGLPLDQSLGNHAAYLQSWLDAMQGDTRFIFRASSQASKAADFILSFSREPEVVEEPAIII
jgi:antirestriction protein ArdC